MYFQPLVKPIWQEIRALMRRADFCISLMETDDASSNEKLGAWQQANSLETEHVVHWYCSLHQCSHCERRTTDIMIDLGIISKLYSLALLL